jgi:hypothetical protein
MIVSHVATTHSGQSCIWLKHTAIDSLLSMDPDFEASSRRSLGPRPWDWLTRSQYGTSILKLDGFQLSKILKYI